MYRTNGLDALSVASKNPARSWSRERFNENFFEINHTPKFSIKKSDVIFTMGSCFAREVESNLIRSKFNLATRGCGIPPNFFDSWNESAGTGGGVGRGQLSRGAFNKYTISSISHELRRVLLNEIYDADGLIEIGPGEWFDPHAAGLKSGPFDVVRENRAAVAHGTAQIRKASVVFLTLGLVEGWVDSVTGLAMNRAPTGRSLIRLANRFALVRPTYEEARDELEATICLIREKCNPDMKFLLTVSPVPFHATFRPMDVVTANTLSKSLLRTFVDDLAARLDFVDYFPSYELVMNSPRNIAWREDHLHVHPLMVAHVMKKFAEVYLS